jgi:hypothetical protein
MEVKEEEKEEEECGHLQAIQIKYSKIRTATSHNTTGSPR